MSQLITGTYYLSKSSEAIEAQLRINGDMASLYYQDQCKYVFALSDLSQGVNIPGVPLDVTFPDGAKFTAQDADVRLLSSRRMTLESLEKNTPLIIASIVLVPALMWFVLMVMMPYAAQKSVAYIPDVVSQQMGQQAFKIIEKTMLEPSVTPVEKQQQLKTQWADALIILGLSPDKYKLHVYASDALGANAFALPDGTVVITDDLLIRLKDNPDAVLAVMLHEIGHVEHKHSLSMVAQSVSSAIAIAMIFGDIEGIGEILIGTGSTLVQSKFSRNMESQADDYALEQLVALNKSPEAFAQAMQSFLDASDGLGDDNIMQYIASHPATSDRIEKAKHYKKKL